MALTTNTTYLSVTETAKLVRNALKAVFPTVKFSVRSSSYSGGASIDVDWTDGPAAKRVEAITERFRGASFDGMIDLKSSHNSEWQGQRVHFGADYVFAHRRHSLALLKLAIAQVAQKWGTPEPRIVAPADYEPYCDPKDPVTFSQPGNGHFNVSDLVHQTLATMEG